jgi:replicative DNA helicase
MDKILGGLQNSDLVILAARPSMGKTSLALDIARNVAVLENKPVGLFSLEMSKVLAGIVSFRDPSGTMKIFP